MEEIAGTIVEIVVEIAEAIVVEIAGNAASGDSEATADDSKAPLRLNLKS